MKMFRNILGGLVALLNGVIPLAIVAVHLATTYYAWAVSDSIVVAAITLFMPPLSEIWWAFTAWMETGLFLNMFTLMILGVVALYAVQIVLTVLVVATEPRGTR